MVGAQDTGVPGYIRFRECILSRGIHMSGPKVSHLTVKGVKQCAQMWTLGGPSSLYIRRPVVL